MLPVQFEDLGSSYLLLFFLIFPFVYHFFIKPYFQQKESVLYTVNGMRMVLSSFSYVMLWVSPMMIFFLNSNFSFAEFFIIFFKIVYVALFFIFVILVVVDFFYYGWQFVFYIGGVNLEDSPKVRKMIKELNLKVKK